MPLTRRDLLEKSRALGAVTLVSACDSFSSLNDLAAQTNSMAFTHLTVIDATGQPPLPDRTVLVVGDRIQSINKLGKKNVPKSARIIDPSGSHL
jgi:hypothetical protein